MTEGSRRWLYAAVGFLVLAMGAGSLATLEREAPAVSDPPVSDPVWFSAGNRVSYREFETEHAYCVVSYRQASYSEDWQGTVALSCVPKEVER